MVVSKLSASQNPQELPKSDPFREINTSTFLEELRLGNAGCRKAFSRLFRQINPHLTSYVGRYFPQTDTAQDVLQEVYLAVHRGLPRFEARSRLSTWIFSLAYHKVCDELAEKYHEKDRNQIQSDRVPEVESNDLPPDEAIIQSERVRMIVDASARLSGKYRDVHILRDFEGMTGEETARVLGIPKALVRVRLHRARCMIVDGIRRRFPLSFKEHRRG